MRTPLTPIICTAASACMLAAGASHWWSVQQFTTAVGVTIHPRPAIAPLPTAPANPPSETLPTPAPSPLLAEIPAPAPESLITPAAHLEAQATTPAYPATPPIGEPLAMQQQFYQELLSEMQQLRGQNRDLLNQVAETNRDLMKLEFRVDTHSDQFRPLPVASETFNASFDNHFDDNPGLLPPRAEPVILPFTE